VFVKPRESWCGGVDLNKSNGVSGADLKMFVEERLCYCPVDWSLK
jgi:hypothetical protein